MPTSPDQVCELVAAHLSLVPTMVAQVAAHYPRHTDREELVQAGRLGLVEAAHRFDADRGVPFDRWASLRIRGAIVDAVRSLDVAPRSLRASAREVETARAAVTAELGRTPLDNEVAERVGITVTELKARAAGVHRALVLSLDAPYGEDEGQTLTLADSLVASEDHDPLFQLEEREQTGYLHDAVTALPARLRAVIEGYFLEGASSAEVAERLGVTESRVSQLRTEALTLLRVGLAAQFADPAAVTAQQTHGDGSPANEVVAPRPRRIDDNATARAVAYTASIGHQRTFAERISLPAARVSLSAPRLVPTPAGGSAPPARTLVPAQRASVEADVALSA